MSDNNSTNRPPVVVVMGHVDHGKSSLLDYIRKTNIVEKEAGGITQKLSAYEIQHNYEGEKRKITFIDTPGHESFSTMRSRGAKVADIAILVVSAEDGVKPQTLDALQAIKEAGISYIVAINKIDLPTADIHKTQASLIENEIYIEGMGGDIPWVAVSAKTGQGIPELLDTIILLSDLLDLKADKNAPASGVIIEAYKDPKQGVAATMIIKNGTIKQKDFIVAGDAYSPVRIMKNHEGQMIKEATFSQPVQIIGFNLIPPVGTIFEVVKDKKEAIEKTKKASQNKKEIKKLIQSGEYVFPIVIKASTEGALDAMIYEVEKISKNSEVKPVVISASVGPISETDVKLAISSSAPLVSFESDIEPAAKKIIRQKEFSVKKFDVIYNFSEWLQKELEASKPKKIVEEKIGDAILLKIFSEKKDEYIIGGRVESGYITKNSKLKIYRRGEHVSNAKILSLQIGKQPQDKVEEGNEFGAKIKVDGFVAENDKLEVITEVEK